MVCICGPLVIFLFRWSRRTQVGGTISKSFASAPATLSIIQNVSKGKKKKLLTEVRACPQASILCLVSQRKSYYDFGYVSRTYLYVLSISVHYDSQGGQSNFECSYPFPSKKQRNDPHILERFKVCLSVRSGPVRSGPVRSGPVRSGLYVLSSRVSTQSK